MWPCQVKIECLSYIVSCGHTCNFPLTLATQQPQTYFVTGVEGGYTCSQLPPTATCSKKFNSMNTLRHVSAILLQRLPLARSATFWTHRQNKGVALPMQVKLSQM